MSAPTTLLGLCYAREVVGYCPAGVQGTFLGIVVDLGALLYFFRPFPSPYRAGVSGRLVPVGSDCASRRRAVSRGSVHPQSERRVEVGSGVVPLWPGHPVGEAGRSRKRAPFLLGQAFRSKTGSPFWPVVRYLDRPRSCASFATSSAGPSFCWEAGP